MYVRAVLRCAWAAIPRRGRDSAAGLADSAGPSSIRTLWFWCGVYASRILSSVTALPTCTPRARGMRPRRCGPRVR